MPSEVLGSLHSAEPWWELLWLRFGPTMNRDLSDDMRCP